MLCFNLWQSKHALQHSIVGSIEFMSFSVVVLYCTNGAQHWSWAPDPSLNVEVGTPNILWDASDRGFETDKLGSEERNEE